MKITGSHEQGQRCFPATGACYPRTSRSDTCYLQIWFQACIQVSARLMAFMSAASISTPGRERKSSVRSTLGRSTVIVHGSRVCRA